MTRLSFLISVAILAALPLAAAEDVTPGEAVAMIRPAGDSDLSEFKWTHRPIVVFADSPADPRYGQQMELLRDDIGALIERDVVILTDTDPAARSPARQKLRPRGFMLVLIGKDGGVKLRKPFPYSVREITRTIDKIPLRQREIDKRHGEG